MPSVRPSSATLAVERFDYARVGEHWAVLRLLTRLGADLGAPADARLIVSRDPGDEPLLYPARACGLERRLVGDERGRVRPGAGRLLWRASFAVPLELAECPPAQFELTASGGLTVALPAPGLRIITPHALRLSSERRGRRIGAQPLVAAGLRHRLVALATAVAVTAGSTPAVALADGGAGGSPSAAATAPAPPAQTVAGPATAPATTTTSTTPAAPKPKPGPATPGHTAYGTTGTAQLRATRLSGAATHVNRLIHPKVTHLFTAPAAAAPGAGRHKVCAFADEPSTPKPVIGDPAATRLAKRLARAQRHSCTAPGAKTRHSGPGSSTGTHGSGSGSSTAKGSGDRPAAAHHGAHRRAHRRAIRTTSGGSAVQPLGGHSARPPLPHSAHSSTPVGAVPTLGTFTGPASWTGTTTTSPALSGALSNLSSQLSNADHPPAFLIPIYLEAGRRYHVPWTVLAAINSVETNYGRDLSTSSAGAIGWMQFMPATWREYGVAADGHRLANPYDPRDAIFSAARYLAAAGGANDIARAVLAYNHAGWYVDMVLSRAEAIAAHAQFERMKVSRRGVVSVFFATGRVTHPTVRYKGGPMSHYDRLIASANMVSAADFPYLYGGGHEQPALWGPFDCSGSVSFVLQQAGYKVATTVSGAIPIWKFPAGPGRVTIFYNPTHTFMRIGSRYFGTSGFARPGGGAGWFSVDKLPADYLAQFREVHAPRLGVNSFAAHHPGHTHG